MFPAQHDLSGLLASSIQITSNCLKEKLQPPQACWVGMMERNYPRVGRPLHICDSKDIMYYQDIYRLDIFKYVPF